MQTINKYYIWLKTKMFEDQWFCSFYCTKAFSENKKKTVATACFFSIIRFVLYCYSLVLIDFAFALSQLLLVGVKLGVLFRNRSLVFHADLRIVLFRTSGLL